MIIEIVFQRRESFGVTEEYCRKDIGNELIDIIEVKNRTEDLVKQLVLIWERSVKKLIKFGIDNYHINEVTVNEQNPQARMFYEYMGFKVYKRTDRDEQGNLYPLLYMKLEKA